jgi:hypothetical protein
LLSVLSSVSKTAWWRRPPLAAFFDLIIRAPASLQEWVAERPFAARWWPVGTLVGIVLLAFGRFLAADYASSDWWPVLATNHLATWSDLPRVFTEHNAARDAAYVASTAPVFRPLGTISYALDFKIWGLDRPWGFQITNLVIHMGVVLATYGLARRLGLVRWAAVLSAAVFTFHPAIVATEPAIGRRLDTLSALFMLASMLLVLRGGVWPGVAAAVLYGCSTLSKETSLLGIPLTFAALAISQRPLWRTAWLVPGAVAALLGRVLVLGGLGGYGTATMPSLSLLPEYREAFVHLLADFAAAPTWKCPCVSRYSC